MNDFKNNSKYNRAEHDTTNFYTCISNKLIQDQRLDFIEIGIMTKILSNSDDYIFNSTYFFNNTSISKQLYFNAIDKLCLYGYLKKIKINQGWNWVINEVAVEPTPEEIEKINEKINKKEDKRKSTKSRLISDANNADIRNLTTCLISDANNADANNADANNADANNADTCQIISNKEIIEKSDSNESDLNKINIEKINNNKISDFEGFDKKQVLNLDYQVLIYLDDLSKSKLNKTRIEFNIINTCNMSLDIFERWVRNYYFQNYPNLENDISRVCYQINDYFNSDVNKAILDFLKDIAFKK